MATGVATADRSGPERQLRPVDALRLLGWVSPEPERVLFGSATWINYWMKSEVITDKRAPSNPQSLAACHFDVLRIIKTCKFRQEREHGSCPITITSSLTHPKDR